MANKALRAEAIRLRLQGYTYGQIKRELNLAKSTLSDWLKNLPLSEDTIKRLSKNREIARDIRIERFRQTAKNKRLLRLTKLFNTQKKRLLPLSERELLMAGLFLYWGEGNKQRGRVAISNTDPRVIQFAMYWMNKILKVPKHKMGILLHLYSDMDIQQETEFWAQTLGIPQEQFKTPYIKKSTREGLTYKGFGHGTCNLICLDSALAEKIAMSIKAICECYGAKSDLFWYN